MKTVLYVWFLRLKLIYSIYRVLTRYLTTILFTGYLPITIYVGTTFSFFAVFHFHSFLRHDLSLRTQTTDSVQNSKNWIQTFEPWHVLHVNRNAVRNYGYSLGVGHIAGREGTFVLAISE